MNVWDWKYRIFFEDGVKKQLAEWMERLEGEEQNVYREISAFYLSFYSFGILFDLICEAPENAEALADRAWDNRSLIVKTPAYLVKYYRQRIGREIKNDKLAQTLLRLLALSSTAEEILPRYWEFISRILGKSYREIIKKIDLPEYAAGPIRLPRQKIIRKKCEDLFDSIYDELTGDETLRRCFGCSTIGAFKTQIIEGNGYGEWWDKDISETGEDELVLYTNENKVKFDDYRYTIIHETYPGHGHFYNAVRLNNACFDQGAMMLIEGWATYCEWNTYPSQYVDAVKHNAMVLLFNSYSKTADEITDETVERNRKRRIPLRRFITPLIYRTQYVGYMEAYYLGALWIECFVKENNCEAKDFLRMLSSANKGEFFRLWE